jgi:DNA-binding Lrp family transcriptional regulator
MTEAVENAAAERRNGVTDGIDAVDRRIVRATQSGLPLVSRPYAEVGRVTGIAEADVIERLRRMLAAGIIRRIGAVPNHFALGLDRNAMTVWDVVDAEVSRIGRDIGALDFVTHCYHRPRALPVWPYNLFAMVHGRSDEEIESKIALVAARIGDACRASDVLVSKRILKKTGLRLAA